MKKIIIITLLTIISSAFGARPTAPTVSSNPTTANFDFTINFMTGQYPATLSNTFVLTVGGNNPDPVMSLVNAVGFDPAKQVQITDSSGNTVNLGSALKAGTYNLKITVNDPLSNSKTPWSVTVQLDSGKQGKASLSLSGLVGRDMQGGGGSGAQQQQAAQQQMTQQQTVQQQTVQQQTVQQQTVQQQTVQQQTVQQQTVQQQNTQQQNTQQQNTQQQNTQQQNTQQQTAQQQKQQTAQQQNAQQQQQGGKPPVVKPPIIGRPTWRGFMTPYDPRARFAVKLNLEKRNIARIKLRLGGKKLNPANINYKNSLPNQPKVSGVTQKLPQSYYGSKTGRRARVLGSGRAKRK